MQPETRKEWLKRRNMVEFNRNSRNSTEGPSRSIEIGQDALRIQAMEARRNRMQECGLCCEMVPLDYFRMLANCKHAYCKICIRKHITFAIHESRIEIPCPGCSADMHPNDVKRYCNQDPELLAKYEAFSLRAALIKIPSVRWCPAPDCGFAVIVPNGQRCPKINCQKPGCRTAFCFECKKTWHEGKTCTNKQIQNMVDDDFIACRPCPRCQTLIIKENDGSCNHMHCTLCRAEFCWLCLKEITDMHYMSPTGCTFWGKKPWSGKKRLMWQLGSLVGSPFVIAATAVISVPVIVGVLPFSVGKKVYKKMKNESKAKRVISTAAAVTGSAIVSPAIAGVAVALGVPFALGYTYIMVPKALLHDIVDYIQKKKRTNVDDVSAAAIFDLQFDSQPAPSSSSAPVPSNAEYRNADGSAPGPSGSATSSDYSEDFSSNDYVVELCDETLD